MNPPRNGSELSNPTLFAQQLLEWFENHGRHDLPWQGTRDPYPIWVSEIMLQQTQVVTVIPYFQRFMQGFPDVNALASASQDEVLHQWTGLGYYTRARNLHKAARCIVNSHQGNFPNNVDAIRSLPGIGPSTAAAILAFSSGQRHAILDGNVKRVLTRFYAIEGYPGQRVIHDKLWRLANRNTPHQRVGEYTQAIMDLGATLCVRRKPKCELCPVKASCRARKQGNPERYPTPKPRKALPLKKIQMLLITDEQGRVLLQRRPPAGVWGGLWCFPECESHDNASEWARRHLGVTIKSHASLPVIHHTFSHYRLDVTPVPATLSGSNGRIMESNAQLWYKPELENEIGLAATVNQLSPQLFKRSNK